MVASLPTSCCKVLVCPFVPSKVHAENGDAVALGQQAVYAAGITGPEGHALSRPAVLEGEATARAIKLAKFLDVPLYVVHVMSIDAMEEVGLGGRVAGLVGGWVCKSGVRGSYVQLGWLDACLTG